MDYVRREGPAQAVKNLILASNAVTQSVCGRVGLSLKHVLSEEGKAVKRLLWKLGFNPELYDDSIQRMTDRLREFRETIYSLTTIETEDDRARIRASGVNLFVSVEELLERIVAFNVWLLAEDHFLNTHFSFDLEAARRTVPVVLGATCGRGEETVTWDVQGRHSLGVLLRYLAEASKWITGLTDADRKALQRSERDLPFYAGGSRPNLSFSTRCLWADCDVHELQRFREGFITLRDCCNRPILQQ